MLQNNRNLPSVGLTPGSPVAVNTVVPLLEYNTWGLAMIDESVTTCTNKQTSLYGI